MQDILQSNSAYPTSTHCRFWFRDVQLIVDSDSAVSSSSRILTPRCSVHRGFWLCSVQLIADSDSAVFSSSHILTPRCPGHCRFRLHTVLLIADSDFVAHHGFWLRGAQLSADSDSEVSCSSRILTPRCPFPFEVEKHTVIENIRELHLFTLLFLDTVRLDCRRDIWVKSLVAQSL